MSILSEDIAWMEPRTLKSRLRNVLMNSLIFKSCHIQEILRAKRRAQDDVPGELLLFLTVQILDDLALIDTPLVGGRLFNMPERSSIVFKNDEHARGAIIQVTNSREPLVLLIE